MKRKNNSAMMISRIARRGGMVAVLVLLFYAGMLLKDIEVPVLLPVTDIEVTGEMLFLDRDEISSMLQHNIEGGYFTLNLNALRQLLLQQAWVKDVSLRRQWPAGLSVSVLEKKPVAYWNEDSFLSETGDVFTPESHVPRQQLPMLNGPEGRHEDVWRFMNQLYSEMALLDYQVVKLQLDDRRAWQLHIAINNGAGSNAVADADQVITVKLGRFETEKRLQRFVRILPVLTAEDTALNDPAINRKIQVIDMRYPNGFAVQKIEA